MKTRKWFLCLSCLFLLISIANSQERLRTVDEEKYTKTGGPVRVSYGLDGKNFTDRNKTTAGADWWSKIKLNVTNTSEKTIVYCHLQLLIEKQGKMPNRNSVTLSFPQNTEPEFDVNGKPTGKYKVPVLKPGETIKLSVPQNQIDFLTGYFVEQQVDDIPSLELDVRYIYFEDGTRWILGRELKKDPFQDKWIPIDADSKKPPIHDRLSQWLRSVFLVSTAS
jgi:hypothetical protein